MGRWGKHVFWASWKMKSSLQSTSQPSWRTSPRNTLWMGSRKWWSEYCRYIKHIHNREGHSSCFLWVLYPKVYRCLNGGTVTVRITDTAGQEDYDRLRLIAYNDVDVLLIAFSVVSRSSFENVTHTWHKDHQKHMAGTPVPNIISYNKRAR